MKKRYILKNKLRFSASLSVLFIITGTLLFSTSAYGYRDTGYTTMTVRQGDTLWSIAEKYNKQGDIRKYIYDIKKINKLSSSDIYAGSELLIPQ
jgi:nucleoid-associated protein YgaU